MYTIKFSIYYKSNYITFSIYYKFWSTETPYLVEQMKGYQAATLWLFATQLF